MNRSSGEPFDFDAAVGRLPRWILLLSFLGLPFATWCWGLMGGTGFLAGALLAYVNFRIVERVALRMSRLVAPGSPSDSRPGAGSGIWIFIQFASLALGAFVILSVSGIHLWAAAIGFFVCPGAVVVEILYELLRYGHT